MAEAIISREFFSWQVSECEQEAFVVLFEDGQRKIIRTRMDKILISPSGQETIFSTQNPKVCVLSLSEPKK